MFLLYNIWKIVNRLFRIPFQTQKKTCMYCISELIKHKQSSDISKMQKTILCGNVPRIFVSYCCACCHSLRLRKVLCQLGLMQSDVFFLSKRTR